MKLIYLHIGYNKTGTTALQNAFYRNSSFLKQKSLLYPLQCRGQRGSPAHHALAESILYKIGKPLPSFVNTLIYNDLPADHFWKILIGEIEGSDCQRVFISSEAFSNLRGSTEEIVHIKEYLEGYEVKILVYLRSQPDFLESAYNQAVKSGGEKRTVDDLMRGGWLNIDYFKEIEQWASVFNPENIIVRIYDRAVIQRGIVSDVLTIIGLKELESQLKLTFPAGKTNKMSNTRLPNNMVELKRKINVLLKKPRSVDNQINYFLHWTGSFLKDKSLLSEEQRNAIINHNYLSNKMIGEKYLNGKFPFF